MKMSKEKIVKLKGQYDKSLVVSTKKQASSELAVLRDIKTLLTQQNLLSEYSTAMSKQHHEMAKAMMNKPVEVIEKENPKEKKKQWQFTVARDEAGYIKTINAVQT